MQEIANEYFMQNTAKQTR